MTVTPAPISNARLAPGPLGLDLGTDPNLWIRSLDGLPRPWFVYESPRGGCVVGSGEAARFISRGPDRFRETARWLDASASAARRDGAHTSPVAVGAFGFGDQGDTAVAWIPSSLLVREGEGGVRVESWQGSVERRAPSTDGAAWADGDRDAWFEAVDAALRRIEAGALEKVVLARARVLTGGVPYDPLASFLALRERYPECHRFLIGMDDGTAFLGASPERLVSLRGRAIDADAVAGTTRVDGGDEDRAARRLLDSAKERNEHAIVAREIVAALRLSGASADVEPEPSTLRLRHVLHLRSRIQGVAPQGVGVLDLVRAIHPSPAVLGAPRDAALEVIHEWEPRDRGWYAGPIGWMSASGDGEFTLGLRSALLDGPRALLHAGAGIVGGSDPEREWEECDAKMRFVAEVLRG
ncbi:MAG TPA: isochorismate synthase [Candidatus Eisenbacteria bacterium]|nr:isochorismate synthase [Candidatus Eisenbacteria bacterium]